MHNFWLAEILLALAAVLVANQYWLLARSRCQSPALLVSAGLLFLALAAAAGAYRYGIDPYTTDLHRALSRLSGYITFLSIGLALLWARLGAAFGDRSRAPAYVALVLIIGAALGVAESGPLFPQAVSRLFSSAGLLLWLLVALQELMSPRALPRSRALLLAAGALAVALAGLLIGTGAVRIFGIARSNWFHLVLAAAALSLLGARALFCYRERDNG